jgi:hypothetical protein
MEIMLGKTIPREWRSIRTGASVRQTAELPRVDAAGIGKLPGGREGVTERLGHAILCRGSKKRRRKAA